MVPTPARRAKLQDRQAKAAVKERVNVNLGKFRRVVHAIISVVAWTWPAESNQKLVSNEMAEVKSKDLYISNSSSSETLYGQSNN